MFLVPLREATQDSGPVLQAGFAGKPDQRGVPRAVQRGFNLVVRAESRVTYGVVRVEIDFSRRLAL
jgi:hypothetical protein